MHYQHAHHVLVENLGLGTTNRDYINWTLHGLWIDATHEESRSGKEKKLKILPGFTALHAGGYVDKITATCKAARDQRSNQTEI